MIIVEGMKCVHCSAKVENALKIMEAVDKKTLELQYIQVLYIQQEQSFFL